MSMNASAMAGRGLMVLLAKLDAISPGKCERGKGASFRKEHCAPCSVVVELKQGILDVCDCYP